VPVWRDWSVGPTRDAILLLGSGIIVAFAHVDGLLLSLRRFRSGYAVREVDDAIFVVFMPSVALIVFGFRWYRDLYLLSKAVPADDVPALIQRPPNHSALV
jgi:hypothetical protein